MSSFGRLVVDTNVVLSASLSGICSRQALYLKAQGSVVLASKPLQELKEVAEPRPF
jgi:predicted nucleic acid-binding protein